MQAAYNYEIKGGLAKLLAEENISMKHDPKARTAYFDIKARVLCLPVWHNISEDLYDMLVVHEVGHALFTPMDKWLAGIEQIAKKHHGDTASEKAKNNIKAFMNVVEDARIDKLQKRRYPGTKRNYVIGYKELNDVLDFFGLKNKDVNSLTLIDRLNVYFKSTGLPIVFSANERQFLKRMESLETFEEVIQLSEELYVFTRDEMKKKADDCEGEEGEGYGEGDGDGEEDEDDIEIDMDEGELEDLLNSLDESDEEAPQGKKKRVKINVKSKKSDEKKDEKEQNSNGSGEKDKEKEENSPSVSTVDAAEQAASKIVSSENVQFNEARMPSFNIKAVVDDFTVVIPQILAGTEAYHPQQWQNSVTKYLEWRQRETDTISYMVKEFEMRKAADAYARIQTAKTGTIDMNKLVRYKFDDDLFRKVTVVPEGKNHGFMLILDWSGSMLSNIQNTVKQLLSLTMFCKRIGVPFEVYTFRSAGSPVDKNLQNTWNNPNGEKLYNVEEKSINFGWFKLRNVLSSRMKTGMYNKASQALWFMSQGYVPYCDPMNSTPLNQAIITLSQMVPEFKKKNKLQIVNTIILTDGASDSSGWNAHAPWSHYSAKVVNRYILKDPVTSKTYWIEKPSGYEMTATYLRILKDRTGSNVIGFHLHPSQRLHGLNYLFDSTILNSSAVQNMWKENKYFGIKSSSGYDEHYVIHAGNDRPVEDMKIDPGMSAKVMAKNFMKYADKKKVNRVLLTTFISRITGVNK